MTTICDYLMLDHKRCDDFFLRADESIRQKSWPEAGDSFSLFRNATERHLGMEEKVLFPTFEQAIRNAESPIALLRREHLQIRGMIERMAEAVSRMSCIDFLLHSETFMLLQQQHNQKEEELLYPLLDKILFLSDKREQIIQAMSELRYREANTVAAG
ncbi:MAG TPA: hemerythrin domain-containing protein [Noviherbaspirillum sp.]|nr:hemerythrin domain-containing protein [Noviherbaspirillum sp.]